MYRCLNIFVGMILASLPASGMAQAFSKTIPQPVRTIPIHGRRSQVHPVTQDNPGDPAAVAALNRMIAATGWNPAGLLTDAVLTGTVTPASGGSSVPVTLKMRGVSEYRVDGVADGLTTSTIVNNGQIAIVRSDGTSVYLALQDLVSTWPVVLPAFSSLPSAANSPSITSTFVASETINGTLCDRIDVSVPVDTSDPASAILGLATTTTVWLDASTGLPVQLQYTKLASDNPSATIQRTRQFSGYQSVNGVQIAFSQAEYAGANILFIIQLSSAAINVGLSDADFTLPPTQ